MGPSNRAADCPTAVSGSSQKLRSACDACHRAKVRCDGAPTCSRCIRDNVECRYSYRAHIGKPKGTLNKKTIERMRAQGRSPPKTAARPTPAPEAGRDAESSQVPDLRFGSPQSMSESSGLSPLKTPTEEVGTFMNMVDMSAIDDLVDFSMLDNDCIFSYPTAGCDNMANLFMKENSNTAGSPIPPRAEPHAGKRIKIPPGPVNGAAVAEDMAVQAPVQAPGYCFCVSVLTGHTQYLHDTWRSQGAAMRLDLALECVQRTSAALATVVQCPSCLFNVSVLLLLVVTLSITLDQILPVVQSARHGRAEGNPGCGRHPIEIRVGNMDVSGHLGEAVQNLVTQSQLAVLGDWLEKFETKLGFGGLDDLNQAQVAFLRSEAKRLKCELERIIEGVSGQANGK